jgi:hypothetical protein
MTPLARAALTWFFLSLMVACTPNWHDGDVKQVQVTKDSLEDHSIDNPYVVDATHGGTVYEVTAGAERRLVQVRAPVDVPLRVLARRFSGGSSLRIGTLGDLETVGFGFPDDAQGEPGVEASCDGPSAGSPGICNCTGKKDCSDMNKAGMCTGGSNQSAVCGQGSNGHWGCSCVAKGS